MGADDAEEEQEESDVDIQSTTAKKSKKRKNKKKKQASAADPARQAAGEPQGGGAAAIPSGSSDAAATPAKPEAAAESSAPKKPKAKKKVSVATSAGGKAGQKNKSRDVSSMSVDELSALLSQFDADSATDPADAGKVGSSAAGRSAGGALGALRTHLALDAPNLDASVELRRQFGAKAISAYESEAASSSPGAAGARRRGAALNPNMRVRSVLAQPKDYWPPIGRTFTGLGMQVDEIEGRGRVCSWEHSR